MDRLERYLDWVCLRINGTPEMRAHIRQEFREHLTDAAAQYETTGINKNDAMKKALDDFGAPEEVRNDLEAAHGTRLSLVLFEKTLLWKEQTMKAKWLWKTWALIALAVLLLLEFAFISGAIVFLLPKYHQTATEVWFPSNPPESKAFCAWALDFLLNVSWFVHNWLLLLIVAAGIWTLFEWRVRSENKSLMRLAAIGTVATGMMAIILLMGIALCVPPLLQESAGHTAVVVTPAATVQS